MKLVLQFPFYHLVATEREDRGRGCENEKTSRRRSNTDRLLLTGPVRPVWEIHINHGGHLCNLASCPQRFSKNGDRVLTELQFNVSCHPGGVHFLFVILFFFFIIYLYFFNYIFNFNKFLKLIFFLNSSFNNKLIKNF
jgi:hypothetical protein